MAVILGFSNVVEVGLASGMVLVIVIVTPYSVLRIIPKWPS